MTPEAFVRIEVPCRDVARQRDFYLRVLGLRLIEDGPHGAAFDLGRITLVLRRRGDALFPQEGGPGALLAFRVTGEDLDRWHRRLLTARAAVLDAPHEKAGGGRALRCADAEGNVIELFAGP